MVPSPKTPSPPPSPGGRGRKAPGSVSCLKKPTLVSSWGEMFSGAGRHFMERVPTLALVPGLGISIAVLAFNLFGDMVRDILDPRLRSGSA
jgi:hypothetical protein